MVYYTIPFGDSVLAEAKTRGWEDPGKRFYQMFYDKTLVRWDLPRYVETEKGFVLQNAAGKMEEKGLQKRTRFFAV